MLSRRVSLVVAGLVLAVLTGCTPTPAPTPTPTGFASEAEAFAAAEETYRAYIDEQNALHAGDESADPLRFQTGELKSTSEQLNQQVEEAGLRLVGDVMITSVERVSANVTAGAAEATLIVCHDSTEQRVVNAAGEDVTPEQDPVYALRVGFMSVDDAMLIYSSEEAGASC